MGATYSSTTFLSQFGVTAGNDQGGDAIKFRSQGSDYRVYIPNRDTSKSSTYSDSDGNLVVKVTQDHILGSSLTKDDHAVATMTFADDGGTLQVEYSVTSTDGAPTTIPKWVVGAADLSVALIGLAGAVETEGGSVEDALKVIEDINSFAETFNNITTAIFKITDDGGRLNFGAVVAHDMAKTYNAVSA